jgi:hypothetical protein
MLTSAILTYEENGVFTDLLSASVNRVVRDDDGVIVIPVEVLVQVLHVLVGSYQADLTAFGLDPSFSYTVHWDVVTPGGVPLSPTTQIGGAAEDSRAVLRRRVGRLLLGRDKFGYGGVTAATVNSVSAKFARRYPDGTYKGRDVYIVSGHGHGQDAMVSNSFVGSGELQVSPGWQTVPDTSSVIEVWSDRVTPDDVNDALNLAIMDLTQVAPVREDRLVQLAGLPTDRLSIPIPEDFTHVFQIESLDSTLWSTWDRTKADPEQLYTMRNRRAYLPTALPSSVTELWIRGYRRPRRLLNDSDICEVTADYVVLMASFYLDASAAEGQALDPEQHAGRAGNWYRQALLRRNELLRVWEPNTQAVL